MTWEPDHTFGKDTYEQYRLERLGWLEPEGFDFSLPSDRVDEFDPAMAFDPARHPHARRLPPLSSLSRGGKGPVGPANFGTGSRAGRTLKDVA
jgi:hypothetical protein